MNLPDLAVRRPITTFVLLVSIFVIGTIALQRLPLAYKPETRENNLFVIVNYPNASPKTVERMIIRPLEEAMSSITGLKHMWSRCDAQGGRLNLVFDWSSDIDMARTEIRDRLDRVRGDLPGDIERISIGSHWNPRETGETIMEARISSGGDLSKDYDLLDRKIIKPLERVPGVAAVLLDGVNPREVKVNLKLNALKRHNLSAREVLDAIVNNNTDRSLGLVGEGERRFTLRALGSFKTITEIEELPLPGTTLRLRDVADITYLEPPLEYGRHLDGKFAVGVSITKESSANTVTVCQEVRERVAMIAKDPDLEGINFLVWEDQGLEIRKTIVDLEQTGLFGAILACVVLFLFLRRLSTTLIAVTCIPFSLIVACGIIWSQGKTLNTYTLLGLIVGIGMLVDNAVVVMENIDRYQQKGYTNRVAALLGAREVSVAVIAATLTSVIVFLPMLFSRPTESNIVYKELAITVIFTLLASLFVSQTLIPLAAGHLVKRPKAKAEGRYMKWLRLRYSDILALTLAHRWLAPVVGLAIIGSAWFPYQKVERNLTDQESQMFVGMNYRFSEDLPLEQKEAVVNIVEAALRPLQEELHVKSLYSWYSQRGSMSRLYMENGYATEEHMNHVRRSLPEILPQIAGVNFMVMESGARFWRRGTGKRVGAQLRGPDSQTLAELVEEAKLRLETIPGLFEHHTDNQDGATELHARIDRDRARNYGINLGQPGDVVELTFRGRRLPRFKGPDGEVEMRLTLDEREDESIDQLKNLPLRPGGGTAIPLESITDFSLVEAAESIQRNDRITSMWVGARFEGGKKEDHMAAVREKLEEMVLPYGYKWDFQSFLREEQENQTEFLISLGLALLLIFGVMAGLFESIPQAIALMISLPFAAAGAWWALSLTSTDLDKPAAVGLLLLLGIVVNNGIVMIEHINCYRRAGMPRRQAMITGGGERLRPILITALTTLVGLVPMAVQQPALGGTYYYSMAFVIMGGLLVSSLMTTLLLPTTVCVVEDFVAWCCRLAGLARRRLPFRKTLPA